jgi:long-chain acyl-CoA synthetase
MKLMAGGPLTWAAQRFAERIAVVCGERTLTFRELNADVNRLAHALLALGLQPGDRVAILQPNCHRFILALFGVQKAGLVAVCLNTRYAAREHAFIVNDCAARAWLVAHDCVDVVAPIRSTLSTVEHYLCTDGDADDMLNMTAAMAAQPAHEPGIEVEAEALARLWYTSGTTGRPKGAMITQAIQSEHLKLFLMNMEIAITPDDAMLHVGPMTHASGNYIMPHVVRGARNVILPRFDPVQALETVARQRITMLHLVPTMLVRLLEVAEQGTFDVRSVKRINYGAAPMPVTVLRRAIRIFGPVFRQHYGLTEAVQPVTLLFPEEHALQGDEAVVRRLASAGRPALGVEVKVVDDEGHEVKPGEVGEIVVRGPHVMRGYWNLPDVTAETLRDGWLHTKDMATVDDHGFIYIIDRKDDLIISGGFNIYPREVEEVLYSHPAVREAVVFGIPDEEWGESVMALVALNDGQEVTAEALITYCRQHLASYKKPRLVHFVPELPKSAVGKVLRRELRAQYRSRGV